MIQTARDSQYASTPARTPASGSADSGSTAAGVRGTLQFKSMSFEQQSAYLAPRAVQREESEDAPAAQDNQDAGGGTDADELKATAESLNGEMPQAEFQAVLSSAMAQFEAAAPNGFNGTVKMVVGPTGIARSVEIPSFTPKGEHKARMNITEILKGLKYPAPKPDGRSAAFNFSLNVAAPQKK